MQLPLQQHSLCHVPERHINTHSSTVAQFVWVNHAMYLIFWTCLFLEAEAHGETDNIIMQDKQSAMHWKEWQV